MKSPGEREDGGAEREGRAGVEGARTEHCVYAPGKADARCVSAPPQRCVSPASHPQAFLRMGVARPAPTHYTCTLWNRSCTTFTAFVGKETDGEGGGDPIHVHMARIYNRNGRACPGLRGWASNVD